MATIGGSVGYGGQNARKDVKAVQHLLNKYSLPPLRPLTVDGIAGPNTIDAIRHFQSVAVKMRSPDGRVDPGGKTWRQLNGGGTPPRQEELSSSASATSPAASGSGNLSGAKWWRANQRSFPNSRRIEDLEGDFRDKVSSFIEALQSGGAAVGVSSTLRNRIRAHLMHYSWRVSKAQVQPDQVPSIAGLNIEWDHGDIAESRKAATEMVNLFGMAHIASLTSNHIKGKAIDMTITWKGELRIDVPGQEQSDIIRTGPRTGAGNRELHQTGRKFGVLKLVKDPPHWSFNGG